MNWRAPLRPGMRTYFVPLVAGLVLTMSTFLPWVVVGSDSFPGIPDTQALWVAGLGLLAAVLSALSLVTRKNSRHPLLVIGLAALAVMFLAWRILPRTAGERASTIAEAFAIVEGRPSDSAPVVAAAGVGIYLGLAAAAVIAAFGMTIVIKRAATPYAVAPADDDVE